MELKRIIMTRLDDFCSLLEDIYGKSIVKSFTTRNGNNDTLTMNDFANNQKVKKEYHRNEGEGCSICKDKFRNKDVKFFKRNLEFPGWIGPLNFNFDKTTPAKNIMIIGEAPTTLKEQIDQINIAFGLGMYPINSNGELDFDQLRMTYLGEVSRFEKIRSNQEQRNGMWKYLNRLFSRKLDNIKDQIYITDLCKCNDDIKSKIKKDRKNEEIWKECRDNYLIEEIRLINPKLIIFQGGDSYTYVMRYLKSHKLIKTMSGIVEKTDCYYPKSGELNFYKERYSKPCFGRFSLNGKEICFFKIYHQAARYMTDSEKDNYIKQNRYFINNKILKEVLKMKLKW